MFVRRISGRTPVGEEILETQEDIIKTIQLNNSEITLIGTAHVSQLSVEMVEEKIAKLYSEQEMRCPVHLSIGQEAPAVGVCALLNKNPIFLLFFDRVICFSRNELFSLYICFIGKESKNSFPKKIIGP